MTPFSSVTSRLQFLWLASIVALGACGDAMAPEVSEPVVTDEIALTRPLQSGIARRTYGSAKQTWVYTIKVADSLDLAIDLTGKGEVTLVAQSADASQACSRTGAVMDHHCGVTNGAAGIWTITVTGVTDFSGSLVATLSPTAGVFDAGLVDAGVDPNHGPLVEGAAVSDHTTMGVPDIDDDSTNLVGDHHRLIKSQYVVSYDSKHKVPRWVSWQLTASWLGSVGRSSTFSSDPQLPMGAAQGVNADYDQSGYARGHMCPSADRSDTAANNLATFLLTNVVPQSPTLNNGPWKGLENEERQLAASGKTVFVVAGPILGPDTIGTGVSVPVATWKVVVVLDAMFATSASVTEATQVIAVIMPNDTTATKRWTEYRTTVRTIEEKTGLNLLRDVASKVQEVIETRVDTTPPI